MKNKKRVEIYMRNGSLLSFDVGELPYITQQQYLRVDVVKGEVVHLLTTEVIRWDVFYR